MNILFDQGTPVPLRQHLFEHSVATAYEQGWSNLTNGNLLDTAEQAGYDLLITTDAISKILRPDKSPFWFFVLHPGRVFSSMWNIFARLLSK